MVVGWARIGAEGLGKVVTGRSLIPSIFCKWLYEGLPAYLLQHRG